MKSESIPVIDIQQLKSRETLATLDQACRDWGFFDHELTKNVRDWKEVYDFGPGEGDIIQPQRP